MGRVKKPSDISFGRFDALREIFPWEEVRKHFDAVHVEDGFRNYGFEIPFTYGYDCESTAFLDKSVLELVGKVKIGLPERLK